MSNRYLTDEPTLTEMAQTKKHFIATAAILAAHKGKMDKSVHNNLAHEFAHSYAQENPRFDKARFMKASGVED